MEKLTHKIATKVWNDFIARPKNDPSLGFSFKDLEKAISKILKENDNKSKTN